METREEIEAKQLAGLEQAMNAHDWRYPEANVMQWTLLLWGGHEVQIMATVAGAMRLAGVVEREELAGREPLFTIRAGW